MMMQNDSCLQAYDISGFQLFTCHDTITTVFVADWIIGHIVLSCEFSNSKSFGYYFKFIDSMHHKTFDML